MAGKQPSDYPSYSQESDPRPYTAPAPNDADIRHDELEYDPSVEPRKAGAWLNLIEESEKAFEDWHKHCDLIDTRFASLARLSNMARNKEFQLFWANCEVLKPAIYATPPVPVVVTKFQDRRPVYQAASELLERCCTVAFDVGRINDAMLLARDDLALASRGVIWVRYESAKGSSHYSHERVCYDFKNRRDFLHSVSRTWPEVWWVAAASYLTRDEARARFYQHSKNAYQDAEYRVDKDIQSIGGADNRERAKFWEIWNKNERRVVWVAQGCEDILDEDDPHLELANFFPCPCPAYGTVQRGSLVPVPDVLQYKDQLDEIDMLTGRIHALSDVIEAKGFYPAGGAELSEAINTAVSIKTPGRVLVPISNWAAFGGSNEVIIWLPIDMIAQVVTTLVDLRKQVIDDVYQIMGLADIMRGATDPSETLGAQQLKTQYGSSRVRDKQYELERIARDLVEITADIITEKFDPVTMIQMSQTQLPTQAMQTKQIKDIQKQLADQQLAIQKLQQLPQAQQMAQQNPDQAAQMQQQAQQMIQSGNDTITQLSQTADAGAGAGIPRQLPLARVHARHRDRQHHCRRRERREGTAYGIRADAGRAAAATGAIDGHRAAGGGVLRRDFEIRRGAVPRRAAARRRHRRIRRAFQADRRPAARRRSGDGGGQGAVADRADEADQASAAGSGGQCAQGAGNPDDRSAREDEDRQQ